MVDSAGPLVGRAEEMALVERALTDADAGAAVALGIAGEPGIGKSRLLAEIARLGEERGCLVLAGRASELEGDLPYGVFVDALDDYVRTLDRAWIEGLDRESAAAIRREIELARAAFGPEASAGISRFAERGKPSLRRLIRA